MTAPSNLSRLELIASLPQDERRQILQRLTDRQAREIQWSWRWNARPNQLQPGSPFASEKRHDWLFWLLLAGRGFGKTRTGAETVREWAEDPNERILMIAPTVADIRDTMIEGPSGLLACYPIEQRPVYHSSKKIVEFNSGAIGILRSADEPERLRGPQFKKFWFDELGAAKYAQDAWDQVQFGFRMAGAALKGVITTTPKPTKLIKSLVKDPDTVVTRGSSYENRSNISETYFRKVIKPYEGTRLGRQEINAEILEDVPGALWTRGLIEATRITLSEVRWDLLIRIVIAIDPAVTSKPDSDETGIIVAALTRSAHVVILDDLSGKYTALEWAKVALAAFVSRRADRIVGEVNNGGDLVARNLMAIEPNVPFRAVRASRGKALRAEPVSNLYEQGRVHHVGSFPDLEDQLCSWTPQSPEDSPDRLDALVWAVTELLIEPEEAGIRLDFGGVSISPV